MSGALREGRLRRLWCAPRGGLGALRRVLGLGALCCATLGLLGCQTSDATHTLSLGPQQKTLILVVEPGEPLQILSRDVVVEVRRLGAGEDEGIGRQRIDGWVAMPPSHWAEVAGLLAPPEEPPAPTFEELFPPPPPVPPIA